MKLTLLYNVGECACDHEPFTFDDPLWCIELQQIYGDTAYGCFRNDKETTQLKVVPPGILARMKQGGKPFGGRVERGKIAALELIAGDA